MSEHLPTQEMKDRLIALMWPHARHYAASELDYDTLAWLESVPTRVETTDV
jgi:hypothetical protein